MRYFTVLAEELNFTRAAGRLHIAQPALSQQIKSLEQQLGTRLIERGSQGCALTPTGILVAKEARQVLEQLAAADSTYSGYRVE
jgi:DNA-binding transcriptional LysR family regulator